MIEIDQLEIERLLRKKRLMISGTDGMGWTSELLLIMIVLISDIERMNV